MEKAALAKSEVDKVLHLYRTYCAVQLCKHGGL